MTRRDAAVLLFVGAGIYCLVRSLGYLSGVIELLGPQWASPPDFNPTVMFLSYLVPFGVFLATGPLLIQRRHALAAQLFNEGQAMPTSNDQPARVQALGSIVLAAFGLLCFFDAMYASRAIISLAQPYNWKSISAARIIVWGALDLGLVVAYVWLGWWLVSRRERLAARWLVPAAAPSPEPDPESKRWEAVTFRVLGLYFVMLALWPVSHALVRLAGGGIAVLTTSASDFWPDAASGTVQLLFGLGVFAGKKGMAAAWRRVVSLEET